MLSNKFYSRELKDTQKDDINTVQSNFTMLYDYLDSIIPEGREKSLYTTKLEEACMWATKAISIAEVKEEGELI